MFEKVSIHSLPSKTVPVGDSNTVSTDPAGVMKFSQGTRGALRWKTSGERQDKGLVGRLVEMVGGECGI